MAANVAASLLEIERDRLQGAVKHLERSVVELKQAIAEEGPHQDYKDAVNENVVVIAKYRARIAALEDEIRRAKAGEATEFVALPIDDADAHQQQQPQQRQQHTRLTTPAASETTAQHQHTSPGSSMDGAAAAAMELAQEPAAVPATGGTQMQTKQQPAAGSNGVWL